MGQVHFRPLVALLLLALSGCSGDAFGTAGFAEAVTDGGVLGTGGALETDSGAGSGGATGVPGHAGAGGSGSGSGGGSGSGSGGTTGAGPGGAGAGGKPGAGGAPASGGGDGGTVKADWTRSDPKRCLYDAQCESCDIGITVFAGCCTNGYCGFGTGAGRCGTAVASGCPY